MSDHVRGSRRLWWREPYVIVAAVVVLWMLLVTLTHAWGGDFRLHLATVHALAGDLWKPKDPLVGSAPGSPYYSPYTVLLGAIAAVTGAHPQTVLEFAGIANVVLLLVALRRFCRNLGGGWPVAALAAVFTLLLWGLHPIEWSGFLGLYSLSWTMSYPSVLATALMLLLWDAFLRFRAEPGGWGTPCLIVVLGFLLVLIHPFTAINAVIGLVAFAVADIRALLRVQTLWLGAAAVVILVLVIVWPWSDVLSLFGAAGDFDGVHHRLITDVVREMGFQHYGLALIGLPALITGARRPLGRELQILFVMAVTAIGVGAITGSYGLARVIPVAMLPLHLALASSLGRWRSGRSTARTVYAGVALAACVVGLYGESGGIARAYWGRLSPATLRAWGTREVTTDYDSLVARVRPGDVVISDGSLARRLVNSRGAYTVVPAWPYPFVDEATRLKDTNTFFAAATSPRERRTIADRYRLTCVLAIHHPRLSRPGAVPGFREQARTPAGDTFLCRR
ncbi:MAG: hypothetical protein JWO67_337 [Streptosporangiaceae bacterium]|nr:hypothetical protein [Streptosporangiaceae bacterium]